MQSLPDHKTTLNTCDTRKDPDILKSVRIRGIGFSGPCQTPDFVPASIYLKSQKSGQDTASGDDTTAAESIVDFSPSPVPLSPPSPSICKPKGGPHLTDVSVSLTRDQKGFGLRLIGGAEEGTQVSSKSYVVFTQFRLTSSMSIIKSSVEFNIAQGFR